ncbi:protein takeout-like [Drosophila nasuta]|uniref:protein takeout-like n=1 Tax=Drosophila nasuta TaxID=42062 RepID=UPI00295E86EE|nr:protein takeout-like [Drosophila nasuta]
MLGILKVVISLQFLVVFRCQTLTLPKGIQKCNYGDLKCIIESMNNVIKQFPKGIPAIGMIPTDVVDVPNLELWNNDESGGVWLKFQLFNQINYGFENTTITKLKGFGRDPTATTMEIHGQIPSLIHKGSYIATGRVGFTIINTTGESVSDFQHFQFTLKLKVITEYRNNTRYLKIYELVPIVKMKRWILWLDEFFKENSDLTLAVNKVFNAHWVEFYNEMEPSILDAFSKVFTSLIGGIFHKVPYDELFLKNDFGNEQKS